MRTTPLIANHLLTILGIVWLLVAAGLFVYQLTEPVTIEWTTVTEQNTAGFLLYRSTEPAGDFSLITDEIIVSQGNAFAGANYSFADTGTTPGTTYYYLLEEVENDGTSNRYVEDMISRHKNLVDGRFLVLIAGATLIGIALIITGIREGDRRYE